MGYGYQLGGRWRVCNKVRLNLYYLQHYSFWMDLKMIFATVLGRKIEFAGEEI